MFASRVSERYLFCQAPEARIWAVDVVMNLQVGLSPVR